MSQPTLKLTYFAGRGRGEVPRLLLAAADWKYEDVRVSFDDWGALKPTTPWGQMPVLEVDGKTVVAQSGAISRYLARLTGAGGSTPLESAQIESIHDATIDLGQQLAKARFGGEEEKKKAAEDNKTTHIPAWAGHFEKHLKANNDGKGYFVGNHLTLADVAVFNQWSNVLASDSEALKNFPLLTGLIDRVGKNEQLLPGFQNAQLLLFKMCCNIN